MLAVFRKNTVLEGSHDLPVCLSGKGCMWIKIKVKCTLVQALRVCRARTAHRGIRGKALLFLDHGTRRGEASASRPGRPLTRGKTRCPLYRRLGGPQGRSGQVRKISPPPGFDPRTVQPVASRYTDYAIRPYVDKDYSNIFHLPCINQIQNLKITNKMHFSVCGVFYS